MDSSVDKWEGDLKVRGRLIRVPRSPRRCTRVNRQARCVLPFVLEEEMKLEAQGGSAEVSESEVSPSSNGIGTSAIQEPYTPAIERSRSSVSGNGNATGPRTRLRRHGFQLRRAHLLVND